MTTAHYMGAALVLLLITAVGIYSGRQIKNEEDFAAGGRRAGAGIVAGSIIGTLVGGSATIGTAQLAFNYGFSAWWFTLGGGLSCLTLALFFVKPFYNSGVTTLPQIYEREYGIAARTTASALTSLAGFLSIVSQILSGIALITAVSALPSYIAVILVALLMLFYVVFGGVWGTGMVGIAKTLLIYAAIGLCGVLAITNHGGISAFTAILPAERYFNLLARGPLLDIGSGVSIILGVVTSQSYLQAIVSARSLRLSMAGTLVCAGLIPLVGVASTFVGMYMRINYPNIAPSTALPQFILLKLPPVAAGMVLAALLVTLVGTGASVALGIGTMFCKDIYARLINPEISGKKALWLNRAVIVVVLVASALITAGNMDALILGWGVLGMGMRGAVAFGALCTAIYAKGKISSRHVVVSMYVGPVAAILGKIFLPPEIDCIFPGIGAAALVLGTGYLNKKRKPLLLQEEHHI